MACCTRFAASGFGIFQSPRPTRGMGTGRVGNMWSPGWLVISSPFYSLFTDAPPDCGEYGGSFFPTPRLSDGNRDDGRVRGSYAGRAGRRLDDGRAVASRV